MNETVEEVSYEASLSALLRHKLARLVPSHAVGVGDKLWLGWAP